MSRKKNLLLVLILGITTFLFISGCSEKNENIVKQESPEPEALSKSKVPSPPPAGVEFVEYDEPPQPIGGYEAIKKHLVYPEIARKAEVQGRVIVWAKLDKQGDVVITKIGESLNNDCDKAALAAIKPMKWKPAVKDGKPVEFCWIAIPVEFKLK